ncbi:hypothetical protein GCK32_002297 [Trichostrongylus colubriformis]|uniref:Uncharacterized protein n=1 Tax=Trichostrongylus colubriformis TaxID=6319 RepID=A0AAN8IEK8_TRICO
MSNSVVSVDNAETPVNERSIAGEAQPQETMDVDMAESGSARNEELEELKVCNLLRKEIKDIEVVVVAEVAKHWRIGDAKRDEFEAVARTAVQSAEKQLECLKKLCARNKEGSMGVRELMFSLGCASRLQLVQIVENLVEKASVLEEVQKCTGWSEGDLVRECSELKRKLSRLSHKEEEILSLQRRLEEKQREVDRLLAEQAATKKAGCTNDESIPGMPCRANAKYSFEGWARVAANIESLDAGQLHAVFKEDIATAR